MVLHRKLRILKIFWILDCQNEPSGDHLMEAYSKSMDIDRFINCTRNTTQANCTETDARKMFEKLSEHFNASQKWCIDALGISEQVSRLDFQPISLHIINFKSFFSLFCS